VTSSGIREALSPLPALGDSVCLSTTFDGFAESFLNYHAGYASVRPALLPLVVPKSAVTAMWGATQTCIKELTRVQERHFGGSATALIEALGYSKADLTWLRPMMNPATIELATCFARSDFVIGPDGLRLIEMNIGPTIGGIGILDRYADLFESVVPLFLDPRLSMPRPTRIWAGCLRSLADAAAAAPRRHLRIVLVVADEETSVPHPHEAAWYLEREEMDVEVVQIEDVHFKGHRAEIATGSIDMIYGCFTYDQFEVPRYRQFAEAALACWAAGGPTYISPPIFTLFGNKAMLTYMNDDSNDHLYGASVAKTYQLREKTMPSAMADRDRLVLKPAIGNGGNGVVIGRDCMPGKWEQALTSAVTGGRLHVLQEYVPPVPIDLPTSNGTVSYNVGIGCLTFHGRFAGLLLRHVPALSGGLINCKQGATFGGACIIDDMHSPEKSSRLGATLVKM
jgi:hypothetical protein